MIGPALVYAVVAIGAALVLALAALAIGVSVGGLKGGYGKPSRWGFWRRK